MILVLFDDYRSKRDRLRLTLQAYRGAIRIDLRIWYLAKDGELKPGKAGFTVPRHAVRDLTDALAKASTLTEISTQPVNLN
jgi:hypothetical protein